MWLVIRNLYTGVKAQVLYSGSLSRKFDILQGSGQGRIPAPFMYKVYINGLLNELTQHSCALSLYSISLTSPSFADDISLLSIYPTFLSSLMNLCYAYSIKWRYEFNHVKSGIVTFGESKRVHSEAMKERTWVLGGESVAELYECKNLSVAKNYIGSFSTNADDNIDKTRKKAGMLFSSNFDRRKVNPLTYIKFWRQACLPTLLYGTELFTLTLTLLAKFARCQQWFLKNVFYVPKFAPCQLLLKLSGLWSIDSEIGLRKLLFLGRLLTGDKMAPVVRNLFQIRSQSYFDANIVSLGVLPSICEALHKFGLFSYFDSGFSDSVFPTYSQWKSIVKTKIREFEVNTWKNFVITHPSYKLAETCLDLVSPQMFWSISNQYSDLVTRLHVQIRLMGNFGFSACVPWTIRADKSLCFVCKEAKDDLFHFLFVSPYFRKNIDSLWSNLDVKVSNSCPTDGSQISAFIKNLDQDSKALLLLGCLPLPFDSMTFTVITRFVASAIGKIYKLRTERLHELDAPWLHK